MSYEEIKSSTSLTRYRIEVTERDDRAGFNARLMLGECLVANQLTGKADTALKTLTQWMDRNGISTEGVEVTTAKWEKSISSTIL